MEGELALLLLPLLLLLRETLLVDQHVVDTLLEVDDKILCRHIADIIHRDYGTVQIRVEGVQSITLRLGILKIFNT